MKKSKIAVVCLLVAIIICGALYFMRIHNIQKEQQDILAILNECTTFMNEGKLQDATLSLKEAKTKFEKSNYKESLVEIEEILVSTEELLLEFDKLEVSNN